MNASFISLGCAKNLVDSECILGLLKEGKITIVDSINDSDIIFINTCGFINSAKKEAIDTILDVIANKKEEAKVVVVGCLAKRYKEDLYKSIPEIDLIIGVDEYDNIGEKINELLNVNTFSKSFDMLKRSLSSMLPVAYVKIGEGCSNKCAYCAIPIIRGEYVSYKKENILDDVKRLISLGKREIILIAQDPTRYGKDIYENYTLEDLLEDCLSIDRMINFRVLYLYPDRITDRLIDIFANNKNLMPYFDIPIQHSSNKILALMSRSGTKEKYIDVINKIRSKVKHAILRTTLITGFPGETYKDFKDMLNFVKLIQFDHLGVFAFSNEEDTPAYNRHQVPHFIAKHREKKIMLAQQKISLELNQKRIGEVHDVLIEEFDGKYYYGRSYLYAPDAEDGKIIIMSKTPLVVGSYVNVSIIGANNYDLYAEVK